MPVVTKLPNFRMASFLPLQLNKAGLVLSAANLVSRASDNYGYQGLGYKQLRQFVQHFRLLRKHGGIPCPRCNINSGDNQPHPLLQPQVGRRLINKQQKTCGQPRMKFPPNFGCLKQQSLMLARRGFPCPRRFQPPLMRRSNYGPLLRFLELIRLTQIELGRCVCFQLLHPRRLKKPQWFLPFKQCGVSGSQNGSQCFIRNDVNRLLANPNLCQLPLQIQLFYLLKRLRPRTP